MDVMTSKYIERRTGVYARERTSSDKIARSAHVCRGSRPARNIPSLVTKHAIYHLYVSESTYSCQVHGNRDGMVFVWVWMFVGIIKHKRSCMHGSAVHLMLRAACDCRSPLPLLLYSPAPGWIPCSHRLAWFTVLPRPRPDKFNNMLHSMFFMSIYCTFRFCFLKVSIDCSGTIDLFWISIHFVGFLLTTVNGKYTKSKTKICIFILFLWIYSIRLFCVFLILFPLIVFLLLFMTSKERTITGNGEVNIYFVAES